MRKIFLFFSLLFLCAWAQGQSAANYTFSSATNGSLALDRNGNAVDMSTGTTQLVAASQDNSYSAPTAIGFTFYFMGTSQSLFTASSNGLVRLGYSPFNAIQSTYAIGQASAPLIGPFVRDLETSATGKVHYKVVGTSPNRCLVIEWLNMGIDKGSSTADGTFQARLYEDGVVEFVYGAMAVGTGGTTTAFSLGISSNNVAGSYAAIKTSDNTVSTTTNQVNNYAVGAIADLNSAADGSRKVYTFTPKAVSPATPAAATTAFTSVSPVGMTFNWVDNSSSETYFNVYQSLDGASYSKVATVSSTTTGATGDAYSYTASGLTPETSYYYAVEAANEGSAPSAKYSAMQATTASGIVYSTTTGGDWASTSTWEAGVVPTANDQVVIKDGATVTVSTDVACYNLTVGQGVSGTLSFNYATALSLRVGNNVTVSAGATFDVAVTNAATGILYVGGDLTNNNVFNFFVSGTAKANIVFNGSRNCVFGGTGTTTKVNDVKLDMTSHDLVTSIEIASFTVQGSTNDLVGFYSTTKGVLRIGGTFTMSSKVFYATGNNTINGGIWLDNPNFTVTGVNGTTTVGYMLRVSQGIYNIGSASGNSLAFNTDARCIIEGGVLNVAGRLETGNSIIYKQSGGVVNVSVVGHSSTNGSFDLRGNYGEVLMTGGVINIVLPNSNANPYDYRVTAGGAVMTGGIVNLGTAATPAGAVFQIQGNMPSLVLDNSAANRKAVLKGTGTANATVYGSIHIKSGTTLDLNGRSLFVKGALTNEGTIEGSLVASSRLVMQGSSAQTIGGTINSSGANFSLELDNTAGATLLTPVTVNQLALKAGVLICDATNFVTVAEATDNKVTSQNNSYVSGPLVISIGASVVNKTFQLPLGKSAYSQLNLVNANTGAGGPVTIKAEVFDANVNGTAGADLKSINTDRYWKIEATSGGANFSNAQIRLVDASASAMKCIAYSADNVAAYTGNPATYGANGNTLLTNSALTGLGYFVVGELQNMTYTGVEATANDLTAVNKGATDKEILGIRVKTTIPDNPISVTQIVLDAAGTTDVADISEANLFYTGTSGTFVAGTSLGTVTGSSTFTFNVNQQLSEGINYFWLAYDIASGAVDDGSHVVDASLVSLTVGGSVYTVNLAPAGSRIIQNVSPLTGTKTISGSGGDYTSIAAALADLNLRGVGTGGVTFVLSDDETYTEGAFPKITATGTAANPIVFRRSNTGANRPLINYTSTGAIFDVQGGDYITFDGLNVVANPAAYTANTYAFNFSGKDAPYDNGCNYNTVKNCVIDMKNTTYGMGITFVAGSDQPYLRNSNNKLYNNSIINCKYGINFNWGAGSSTYYDENNEIGIDATPNAESKISQCAEYMLWFAGQKNMKVFNTDFDGLLGTSGNFPRAIYGLGSGDVHFYNNRVHNITTSVLWKNMAAVSIEVNMNADVYFYNNMTYDFYHNGAAANLHWGNTFWGKNIYYYNNLVNLSGEIYNASSAALVVYNAEKVDMRNNILINTVERSTVTRLILFNLPVVTKDALASTCDNNILYMGTPKENKHFFYSGNGELYTTLAAYKAALGNRETHSFEENVPFVDPNNGQHSLINMNISPDVPTLVDGGAEVISIANGAPINLTTDIDGELRDTESPDLGPDEGGFIAIPSVANSVVTATPSTISSGQTSTLKLQPKYKNGNNIKTGGLAVSFAIASGDGTGSIGSVTDNADGTYTATFTATGAGSCDIESEWSKLPYMQPVAADSKAALTINAAGPAAPTSPVVNDAANTFGWTNVSGYSAATDYEYSVNSGTDWTACTANPVNVGNNDYAAGVVMVRVKANAQGNGQPAGAALASDAAFKAIPAAPTAPVVNDAANTFGWTNVSGYSAATDYEYSVNSGANWTACTANPVNVGNNDYAAGVVMVRVKANAQGNGRDAGETLASNAAFKAIPAAPTAPVVNDAANTFGWTNVSGYSAATDYEYSVNSGANWTACTANPVNVGNNAYASGAVMVRVKANAQSNGRDAGESLASTAAFTITPDAPTNPVHDDVANTFGWTNVTGYSAVSDYEYSVNSGSSWTACTANPQPVGDASYAAGAVRVRVKADAGAGRQAGNALSSTQAYTLHTQVRDLDAFSAKVYPNPFGEMLTLELNRLVQTATVRLVDVNGKVLIMKQIAGQRAELNTSMLARGIYVVRIDADGYRAEYRVVKN